MIVHHPDSLQKRVTEGRSEEAKAAPPQIARQTAAALDAATRALRYRHNRVIARRQRDQQGILFGGPGTRIAQMGERLAADYLGAAAEAGAASEFQVSRMIIHFPSFR
jgi:hypothetical protein